MRRSPAAARARVGAPPAPRTPRSVGLSRTNWSTMNLLRGSRGRRPGRATRPNCLVEGHPAVAGVPRDVRREERQAITSGDKRPGPLPPQHAPAVARQRQPGNEHARGQKQRRVFRQASRGRPARRRPNHQAGRPDDARNARSRAPRSRKARSRSVPGTASWPAQPQQHEWRSARYRRAQRCARPKPTPSMPGRTSSKRGHRGGRGSAAAALLGAVSPASWRPGQIHQAIIGGWSK